MQARNKLLIFGIIFLIALATYVIAVAVTSTSPANNVWINGTATTINFTGTYDDTCTSACSCDLVIDGVNSGKQTGLNISDVVSIFSNVSIAEGTHAWYFNCTNTSVYASSTSRTLYVDRTPTAVSLESPATGLWTVDNTPNFLFNVSDNLATSSISCELFVNDTSKDTDSSVVVNTSTAFTSSSLSDGFYNWHINCTDRATNMNSSESRVIKVDTTDPTINLTFPANNTLVQVYNTTDFNFTLSDNLATSFNCSLYINGTRNITTNGLSAGDNSFGNKNFTDGEYLWYVSCIDQAGNTDNSATRYFTVDVVPEAPLIWTLPTLTNTDIMLYGYFNKSNITATAFSYNGTNYTDNESVPCTDLTTLLDTSQTSLATSADSEHIMIADGEVGKFVPGRYIELAGHYGTNFLRYKITSTQNIQDGTLVFVTPNLRSAVDQAENVYVYNTLKPKGWCNITLDIANSLHSGNNSISMLGERLGYIGPAGIYQYVYYDNQTPTTTISSANYSDNSPQINFTITDDYGINLSSMSINLSGQMYNQSNATCSGTTREKNCSITPTLNDSFYNITITVQDTIGNSDVSVTKTFLINTQKPSVQLELPANNYFEDQTRSVTVYYNVSHPFYTILNCSLYIAGSLNNTNSSVQTDTTSEFTISNFVDSTYNWNISCYDELGNSNTSETRSFKMDNSPDKPVFATISAMITQNNLSILGFFNKSSVDVNLTITQGERIPRTTNFQANASNAELLLSTKTKSQVMPVGARYIYVNKTEIQYFNETTYGEMFIEFGNHKRTNFLRYNISDITLIDNQYYAIVNLTQNLSSMIVTGTTISIYNESKPSGWFNITLTNLFEGANDITMIGERLGLVGPMSDTIDIFFDNQPPVINTTGIIANSTSSSPTLAFRVQDDYNVSLTTLLVLLNNGSITTRHVWNQQTDYNDSGWVFGVNISCAAPYTNSYCTLLPTLDDGNYTISITVNDTAGHNKSATVRDFIVKTRVGVITAVTDPSATTSSAEIYINWTNISYEPFFSHYEVSIGTELYPAAGFNNINNWFTTTNNYVNLSWNITPGYMYYFNVRAIDIFGNQGNVTSSNGIIYEDNTQPIFNYLIQTATNDSGLWTNSNSTLGARWNFTDPETGIAFYEYAIGTNSYPYNGWNTTKPVAQTVLDEITNAGLTLVENGTYYFSVRAKNNYQYTEAWSDWETSASGVTVDLSKPTGGSIYYPYGNFTVNGVEITFRTGDDAVSGFKRASILYASAPMDNGTGACGSYQGFVEIENVSKTDNNRTYNFNLLENGYCYKFALRVWDRAGNMQEYLSGNQGFNITVDSSAPSQVTISDEGQITGSTTLTYSWTEASDPHSGISGYRYRLYDDQSNTLVGWTSVGLQTNITLESLSLIDEYTYYIEVEATNNVGLTSLTASNGIMYLDMDTPAAVTVMQVENDTNVSNGWLDLSNKDNTTINLTGEAGIHCAWSLYDVDYADPQANGYITACANPINSTSQMCVVTNISQGVHNVHVVCEDTAGNRQSANENTDFMFTKEYQPPLINITAPENNDIVNGVVSVQISIWDVSSYTDWYELRKVDNGNLVLNETIGDPTGFAIDTTFMEGEYNLTVFARDTYNYKSNASIIFIVDNNAPTTSIILGSNYYNQNFSFTIRSTLFANLSYTITNSTGALIQSQTNTSVVMRNASQWLIPVNVDLLKDDSYTIISTAIDDEANTRTDTETFYIDTTAPDYRGDIDIEPTTIYENQTISIYLNWKEMVSLDAIWVRHNANESFVNYTASSTTPGDEIYENYTRYKVDIPTYMTTTSEVITYTWHARDNAGNEVSYGPFAVNVTNRDPNITTNNLTSGWATVYYQELISFIDLDTSQSNSSYFNCTLASNPAAAGLNISVVDNTKCLLEWGYPIASNYSVNITVTDYAEGSAVGSVTAPLELIILPTAVQNNTVNTSHTVEFLYNSGGELQDSESASSDMNITLPTSQLYTVNLLIDNLYVTMQNYNVTDNMNIFFQMLNSDNINDSNTSIGSNDTYRPLEAYAFRVTSNYNGTYIVGFNYSGYGVAADSLKIFKFDYDEQTGEINYSSQQSVTTSVNSGTLIVSATVSNFSAFILTRNVGASPTPPGGNNNGNGGGGNGGGGGSSFYTPAVSCTDGFMNGLEEGIDCGGSCTATCETCHDLIQNQNEIGIDCGGECAPCHAPTCTDGIMNDGETGVDCGGPCQSCEPIATCDDNIWNGGEEDVDCGGSCIPCVGCDNGIKDAGEEGVDCGSECGNECGPSIIETPVRETPKYMWILLIGFILIGGIAALWIYNREEKVVKSVTAKATFDEQEVTELKEEEKEVMGRYVSNYLLQGLKLDHIKTQLLVSGFKEPHIDAVMATVLRDKKVLEIQEYLDNYSKKGHQIDELKQWVLGQGVEEDMIDEAIARREYRDLQR
ncbi:fibronectin type III domain-containing protein [archaeon]|nr:fibronectin type III domain-containing protein [archaeon]MBL7056826.1 fibronectin type III domain-containing protein [Candidatus Woesearchaeota archaeon]